MDAPLTLLHTCDAHGHWSDARVAAIRRLRDDSMPALLLDCGDALRAGNLNPGYTAERDLKRMNLADYDAMAVGNRETHLWKACVQHKLRAARFPIVSSNLTHPTPPIERWVVLNAPNGMKVGVMALTPVMVRAASRAAKLVSVTFRPVLECAEEALQALRSEADLLVCLCHLGSAADTQLADLFPDIDIIIGGHDHTPGQPAGRRVNGVLIARSSPYLRDIGTITVRRTHGRPETAARLLPLNAEH